MKKILLVLAVCATIAACGGKSTSGSADSTAGANQTAKAQDQNADTNANKIGTESTASLSPGAKLIAANDCATCHKMDTKVIGPAFKDIAAKYPSNEANIDTLANKVLKGGKGNWGDIPMAAHPTLALADAKTIVTYILSLKK